MFSSQVDSYVAGAVVFLNSSGFVVTKNVCIAEFEHEKQTTPE